MRWLGPLALPLVLAISYSFVFEPSVKSYEALAIVPTLEWRCKGDFGHLPDARKQFSYSVKEMGRIS
jgi:hypothetical protein